MPGPHDHEEAGSYTAKGTSDFGFRTAALPGGIKNGVFVAGYEDGVYGRGGHYGIHGMGVTAGVRGVSDNGPGVVGESETGQGGSFESRKRAQIRLYPTLRKLPVEGAAGDLIAIDAGLGEYPSSKSAELWFCVESGDTEEHPARWGKVQFSEIRPTPG